MAVLSPARASGGRSRTRCDRPPRLMGSSVCVTGAVADLEPTLLRGKRRTRRRAIPAVLPRGLDSELLLRPMDRIRPYSLRQRTSTRSDGNQNVKTPRQSSALLLRASHPGAERGLNPALRLPEELFACQPTPSSRSLPVLRARRFADHCGGEDYSPAADNQARPKIDRSGSPLQPYQKRLIQWIRECLSVDRAEHPLRSRRAWPDAGILLVPHPPGRHPPQPRAARPRGRRNRRDISKPPSRSELLDLRGSGSSSAPIAAPDDHRFGDDRALKRSAGGKVSAFIAPCGSPNMPPVPAPWRVRAQASLATGDLPDRRRTVKEPAADLSVLAAFRPRAGPVRDQRHHPRARARRSPPSGRRRGPRRNAAHSGPCRRSSPAADRASRSTS